MYKKNTEKSKLKKKRKYTKSTKLPMETQTKIVDIDTEINEDVLIDNVSNEENIISEHPKPCNSCAIQAIDKKLKYNYIFSSIALLGIIFGIVVNKKEGSNKLFVGISIGIFFALLFQSLYDIQILFKYKKQLLKQTA